MIQANLHEKSMRNYHFLPHSTAVSLRYQYRSDPY